MHGMEVPSKKGLVLMPTYDFKCGTCGAMREVFIYHKEYEKYAVRCAVDYKIMERVYPAPPAIKFNGTGFYSTGG